MQLLQAVRFNLTHLADFKGRESSTLFWPYAGLIIVLMFIAMALGGTSEFADSLERMQAFAVEHPELATIESGPGHYSISIEGNHPELAPDLGPMMVGACIIVVIAVILLGAAVARRLHDTGKSGLWGLAPLFFLALGLLLSPKVFSQPMDNMGLFFLLFFNNAAYIVSLITLVVLLACSTEAGENRYGPEPARGG